MSQAEQRERRTERIIVQLTAKEYAWVTAKAEREARSYASVVAELVHAACTTAEGEADGG